MRRGRLKDRQEAGDPHLPPAVLRSQVLAGVAASVSSLISLLELWRSDSPEGRGSDMVGVVMYVGRGLCGRGHGTGEGAGNSASRLLACGKQGLGKFQA